MSSSENALPHNTGYRNRFGFRGIIIAILAAFVTAFVLFIFSPLFPINIFDGVMGYVSFGGIIILSYIFYLFLPQDNGRALESSQDENKVR
ncbi:MAG: hypothetical protein ACFFE8_14595 [Candidatus Heimdallarchaeota archaeon]